jgi:hypothetical protein
LSQPPGTHNRTIKFVAAPNLSVIPFIAYESSKVLNNVMRDYQPIWRIRSRMSPL